MNKGHVQRYAMFAFGCVLLLAIGTGLDTGHPGTGTSRPAVSAAQIASAKDGTIAVNFEPGRQFRFKFVDPPSTLMRVVVWCSTGMREVRSFVTDGEIRMIEILVQPDEAFYDHALADCARELGR